MSLLSETSLTSMKATFLAAPDPLQGIPTLTSLIDLMLQICQCSQTQKTPASATMNLLFCAASLLHPRRLPCIIFCSRMKLIQSQISLPATLTTTQDTKSY